MTENLHKIDFVRLSKTDPIAGTDVSRPANYQTEPWHRYGHDNLFPQLLIRYRTQSPTHWSILKLKTDLLRGEGPMGSTELPGWLSPHLISQLAQDYVLFGGIALQVIWSRDGSRIADVSVVPFAELRLAKDGTGYYRSTDWRAWHERRDQDVAPQLVQRFDPEQARSNPLQIWYFADPCPEWPHYPMPSYQAALPDLQWDYEYAIFKASSMQNGMFPALHIHVEADPTDDERQRFYTELKRKFRGSGQAGEALVTFGVDGAGRTSVTPIEIRGNADLFKTWAADTAQRIITAHQLSSPVLAGLPGRGGLGGRANEISVAYEYFFQTVIRPMQLNLLTELKALLAYANQTHDGLEIINSKPIRLVFSETLLAKLLTRDELRQELGYPPVETSINGTVPVDNSLSEPVTDHEVSPTEH